MKIDKEDFKESVTFLWIAVLLFLVTLDVAFPFIMFMMKVVFYIFGSLLFILGITTLYKSIFGKKSQIENVQSKKL